MRIVYKTALAAIALFLVCTVSHAQLSSDSFTLDVKKFGGLTPNVWFSRDAHHGHQLLLGLASTTRLRDVAYVVRATDSNGVRELAKGAIGNLRSNSYENLEGRKFSLADKTNLDICLSYFIIDSKQHYISVNFYEEPDLVGSGNEKYAAGPGIELDLPIRLVHDGSLTCDDVLDEKIVADLQAKNQLVQEDIDEEFRKTESGNPDYISILSISTNVHPDRSHLLEMYIIAENDIGLVDYSINDNENNNSKGRWFGRIPFVTAGSYVDIALSNPEHNKQKKLAKATVKFGICVSYFDPNIEKFVQEKWFALSDYEKMMQVALDSVPKQLHANDKILVSESGSPMPCFDDGSQSAMERDTTGARNQPLKPQAATTTIDKQRVNTDIRRVLETVVGKIGDDTPMDVTAINFTSGGSERQLSIVALRGPFCGAANCEHFVISQDSAGDVTLLYQGLVVSLVPLDDGASSNYPDLRVGTMHGSYTLRFDGNRYTEGGRIRQSRAPSGPMDKNCGDGFRWFGGAKPKSGGYAQYTRCGEPVYTIGLSCKKPSGSFEIDIQFGLGARPDKSPVPVQLVIDNKTFDLFGTAVFNEMMGEAQPIVRLAGSDPAFEALRKGKQAAFVFDVGRFEFHLEGSNDAMAAMREACRN